MNKIVQSTIRVGVSLLIIGLAFSIGGHGECLERNYNKQGIVHPLTQNGHVMAPVKSISSFANRQENDVTVKYKAIVTPGEPDWYSEIPEFIVFSNQNKELTVPVKITTSNFESDSHNILIVKVKSQNKGVLQSDISKENVKYDLTNKDGFSLSLEKGGMQKMFEGPLQDLEIHSKAKLNKEATHSGKYIDVLTYSFSIFTQDKEEKI